MFCQSYFPIFLRQKGKAKQDGDKQSILQPHEAVNILHLESDRNCRSYRICKNNLHPLPFKGCWNKGQNQVRRGSASQCLTELFSQGILVLKAKILLVTPPSLTLQLALSFFHSLWNINRWNRSKFSFLHFPCSLLRVLLDEHTHTHKWNPADSRPVDIFKLLLFTMSVRLEDKLFVSEEHKTKIRARNGFYSAKKLSMAGMISMLKDTLKFCHSIQKALYPKNSLKSNTKQAIWLKKNPQQLTWLFLPSGKYKIKRTVVWQIPLSWTKAWILTWHPSV